MSDQAAVPEEVREVQSVRMRITEEYINYSRAFSVYAARRAFSLVAHLPFVPYFCLCGDFPRCSTVRFA
jgi:hypothetical protein